MPSAVVTGVSSGVGRGIAQVLVRAGVQVFGTVRREEDAVRLRGELGERFVPLLLDVTDPASIARAAGAVESALGENRLTLLINNAGISIHGPLLHQPSAEFARQIEVNLVGPARVIKAFLPVLGADRRRRGPSGRVINISSMGGRIGIPLLSAYSASKFGLEGLSEALRRELRPFGIDVIIVNLAAVRSRIFEKAAAIGCSAYETTEYAPALRTFLATALQEADRALTPEAVGYLVLDIARARRPKARYSLAAHGRLQWLLARGLPSRWVDAIMGRQLHLQRLPAAGNDGGAELVPSRA